jgi:hypothetical protein
MKSSLPSSLLDVLPADAVLVVAPAPLAARTSVSELMLVIADS